MDLLAYALRADYEGEISDGLPRFGGAVLAVGDGDFHVRDSLELNDGTIVVHAHDQRLVDLLDAYPPLKRTTVPKNPVAVSPYDRRTTEDLRDVASVRDIDNAASLSRKRLIAALIAQDAAIHGADQATVEAIADSPADAGEIADAADLTIPTTSDEVTA